MTDPDAPIAQTTWPVPPFPEGARMVFGIGAQKAGTSWLFDYLSQAPDMHFCRNKELHYFDVRAGRAGMALRLRVNSLNVLTEKLDTNNIRLNKAVVDRLRDAADLLSIYTGKGNGPDRHNPYLDYLLEDYSGQKLVGDITPSYSILRAETFADMATVGNARFIFILRDPVSRMWSHLRMSGLGDVGLKAPPEAVLEAAVKRANILHEKGFLPNVDRGDYVRTMAALESVVPADRILYVFYEELFDGPATRQICDFLEIPHIAPDAEREVNKGVSVKLPDDLRATFREAFDRQYVGMKERFGDRLPAKWQV